MLLTKNEFFALLLGLVLLPFLLYNMVWLAGSAKTEGRVVGIGQHMGMNIGKSTYALVSFKAGADTVWFQALDENYKTGDAVAVRYKKSNPANAKTTTFLSLWGDVLAWAVIPLMVVIVLYFSPDMVPKRAMVLVGKKPFIRVIPFNPKYVRQPK
jgi:hypothetical protein